MDIRYATHTLGAASAVFISLTVGGLLHTQDGAMLLWPVGAVTIWWVWREGWRRALPALLLGSAASVWWEALGPALGAQRIAASVLTGVIGGGGMRLLRVSQSLRSTRDLLCFLLIGVITAPAVSSLLAALIAWQLGATWQSIQPVWWACWIAEAIAIVLISPLFNADWRWRWDYGPLALITAISALVVYADLLPKGIAMTFPLSYIAFPLLLLATFRLPLAQMATLQLLNACFAIWGTAQGMGPFALEGSSESILALHGHLSVLAITAWLISVNLAEKLAAKQAAERHLIRFGQLNRLGELTHLATGIAHELNQPLAAVMAYAQGARRLCDAPGNHAQPPCDKRLQEALDRVVSNTERAADIVRNTRAMLRAEPIETDQVNAQRFFEESLGLLSIEAQHAGISLHTKVVGLGALQLARSPLQQILTNLTRNAIEAMQASRVGHRITLHVQAQDDTLVIRHTDNGPGIDPSIRTTLFEPFFTTGPQGIDLGLSISRSIAESLGGQLELEHTLQGTSFRLTLPLVASPLPPPNMSTPTSTLSQV